jgi:hypothetical protein
MDQIHLSPLVDQIQLTLGHISNNKSNESIIHITGKDCRAIFDYLLYVIFEPVPGSFVEACREVVWPKSSIASHAFYNGVESLQVRN